MNAIAKNLLDTQGFAASNWGDLCRVLEAWCRAKNGQGTKEKKSKAVEWHGGPLYAMIPVCRFSRGGFCLFPIGLDSAGSLFPGTVVSCGLLWVHHVLS